MDRIKGLFQLINQMWSRTANEALEPFRAELLVSQKRWFEPIVFIVAIISTLMAATSALFSLLGFFASLLVLYFIFSKIFGLNLDEIVVVS